MSYERFGGRVILGSSAGSGWEQEELHSLQLYCPEPEQKPGGRGVVAGALQQREVEWERQWLMSHLEPHWWPGERGAAPFFRATQPKGKGGTGRAGEGAGVCQDGCEEGSALALEGGLLLKGEQVTRSWPRAYEPPPSSVSAACGMVWGLPSETFCHVWWIFRIFG